MSEPTESRYSFRSQPWLMGGPVTCASCGCRLELSRTPTEEAWYHFGPLGGRDARGHRVACLDLAHNAHGRVAELSVP